MGYRLLGWAFWNFSLKRRLRRLLPSRSVVAATIVVAVVIGLAYAQSRAARSS